MRGADEECGNRQDNKSRREWCRHAMRRKDLVGITGKLAHADRGGGTGGWTRGVEVWEEWTWSGQVKQWRTLTEEGGEGQMGQQRRQC